QHNKIDSSSNNELANKATLESVKNKVLKFELIEYNVDDDLIMILRMTIKPYAKKHKENSTLPDLNKANIATKFLLREQQKQLEEMKKELDNLRNDELETKRVRDKRILKKDENNSVSEHKGFEKLKNKGISSKAQHNKIDSSSNNELANKATLESVKNKVLKFGQMYTRILYEFQET
ncbi:Protein of unknown function (DUF2031), putative, partial [Plasmodium chabaudi adami]